MKNRVTLKDVAQFAGVSVTTVSNVVRGWPYIAEETRQKVQEAIRELRYSPHPIAQGLRTGQMQTIGFIVPYLSNPYFGDIVNVVEDIAQEHHYSVIIFSSHEDFQRQTESIRRATNRLIDGLLIAPIAAAQPFDSTFTELTIPTVVIDRVPDGYTGPSCALNNFQVGLLATRHLCELGHRRIAHLAGPLTVRGARERAEGYRQALHEFGLTYERVDQSSTAWNCEDGYRQMRSLLAEGDPPTAIFAGNDLLAIGAMHALDEAGLSCPDDLSIVGVDDIEVGAYIQPTLTTVRQPLREMARAGIDLLLDLIHQRHEGPTQVTLEPTLIVRHSTAAPPERTV
ncbi:MAG: LacI family DNA-binding transcriptional regulator [Candidatus Flexifilum sp.]